jgi:DNA adenine methylase
MFFFLGPKRAELSDASPALIDTYRCVRRDPEAVLRFLRPLRPTRASFDRIRRRKARTLSEAAGSFIFLNKACWNGLYRVNSDGIFNVPYGWPKTDFVVDEDNLRRCSQLLRRRAVSLRCQDFEEIGDRVLGGDFVFLDPPYVTSHNMNGFVDWNESLFCWQDQIRLARMARRFVARGANVLITNAAHADIRNLYKGFGYTEYERWSTLAGDLDSRRKTSEAIFFGGPAYGSVPLSRTDQQRDCHANAHASRR